jgi:integrase
MLRSSTTIPLTEASRAALDSVCPKKGVIFGVHDHRDAVRKAAKGVLDEENERFPVRARFRLAWETALRLKTISQLSVPQNYIRDGVVLVIADEIDKVRVGRELPLAEPARLALESVCPEEGLIFGEHDYRDQLKKAAHATLAPEQARTFAAYDLRQARATQWAESGNLVGVAYLLGHKQAPMSSRSFCRLESPSLRIPRSKIWRLAFPRQWAATFFLLDSVLDAFVSDEALKHLRSQTVTSKPGGDRRR